MGDVPQLSALKAVAGLLFDKTLDEGLHQCAARRWCNFCVHTAGLSAQALSGSLQ